MNLNKYQIDFKKVEDLELPNYMPLFRYLLYYNEKYVAPSRITFEPNLLQVVEGEVFAHRVGLIMFRAKGEVTEPVVFNLENNTDSVMEVYSEALTDVLIEPIHKRELLLRLPPRFKTSLSVYFEIGRGADHARYSRIEGYRMDLKQNCRVNFEINSDTMDQIWGSYRGFIEKQLGDS